MFASHFYKLQPDCARCQISILHWMELCRSINDFYDFVEINVRLSMGQVSCTAAVPFSKLNQI